MDDQNGIRQVARTIGIEMSALGLHWNFAPVADVNSNPLNPIINIRAFSGKPEIVAQCAISFYEGLEYAGIISTAKHFPGHGDSHIDSHRDLPIIDKTPEEFEMLELLPFMRLAARNIPSIMTGHIAAPKLAYAFGAREEDKVLPATISRFLCYTLLREKIGFDGVIITDSLEMFGLQKIVSDPAEIAIRAFSAGADILLMPTDPMVAYTGLKLAIERERISIQSIIESNTRIEKLRNKYVIERIPRIEVQWLDHGKIAHVAAKNSLTLEGTIAKPLTTSSVIIIASGTESEKKQRELLLHFFSSQLSGIELFLLMSEGSQEGVNTGSKPLILTLYRPRGALAEESSKGSIVQIASQLAHQLIEKNIHPAGVICFGDPYISEVFTGTEPDFILQTYSDSNPSIRMTLQLLTNHF